MMIEHHVLWDPNDPLGIVVIVAATIVTAASFVLAFRMLIDPGEEEPDHPKRVILREDR
jgi:hypothetical protein